MSVKDIFGSFFTSPNSANQTAQQVGSGGQLNAPVNAPPGSQNPANTSSTLGTQTNDATAPNGVIPAEQKEQSPTEVFKDLWEPTKTPAPGSEPVTYNADPKKLLEAASKIDFAQVITPELAKKISAGGQDAATALVEIIQKSTQSVYAQSSYATTKIVEDALAKQRTQFEAALPALIKKQGLGDSLYQENPALNSPAVAPIIAAIQTQLASKHPNATQAELTSMAKEYMQHAASVMNPVKPAVVSTKGGADYDWDKFLSAS